MPPQRPQPSPGPVRRILLRLWHRFFPERGEPRASADHALASDVSSPGPAEEPSTSYVAFEVSALPTPNPETTPRGQAPELETPVPTAAAVAPSSTVLRRKAAAAEAEFRVAMVRGDEGIRSVSHPLHAALLVAEREYHDALSAEQGMREQPAGRRAVPYHLSGDPNHNDH